ncbi:MAG TPA: PEP-CTERM-box response regulator transcription factor [Methylomirabilota bacterium]|nr:PEP-CTERM-box response regulator transcription factor [Methylomirabilota bacterium]
MKSRILLVDDEENLLKQMRWALDSDYDVLTASNENDAITTFENERPPVVTVDLSLNRENPTDLGGLRLVERFLTQEPATRVIVITGNDDDSNALRAVRLGAFDYYCKPIRLEEIKVMIQRALHTHYIHQRLHNSYSSSADGFQGIIGQSKTMQDIFKFIERVAPSDISVLISGESGTGKEMVAEAIHQRSPRKDNPFIAVNCGAIPENLLESELFGHEKGAFTGAYTQKRGKFELAHTGTLFLDEIGELVPSLQVKLLRFLQDRKIDRVGGNQSLELDVRIIAATNRDLKKDMENHVFREDLYYRLKVVPMEIPPLRKRREDIIPLAQHFLKKYCQEHHKPLISLSSETEGTLLMQPWPGNVRELENLISRAVVLSTRPVLQPTDLGLGLESVPSEVNLKFAKKAIELDFVKKALSKNKGIVSRAARELGISRVNLYELIEKYSIQVQEYKVNRARAKQ